MAINKEALKAQNEREKEQAEENPVFLFKALKFTWWAFRFHPLVSAILTLGLLSAPGAIFAFISGAFFANPVPQNAAIGERFTNGLGVSLARPVGTTLLVSAEAAYRSQFAYQPADNRKPQTGGTLSVQDLRKLEQFAKQNNGILIRFNH